MAGRRDIYEKALNEGISAAWDQQWDKAIAAYRVALEEFPDDATVLANLGQALLAINKHKEALIVYQRAARVSPGDPVPIEKCAELMEGFGQNAPAAQAYFAVGELYVNRREIEKAIENWGRSAALVPNNINARSRLAVAFERIGKTAESIAEYVEVARIFQSQGDIPKAMQTAQRALQVDPQSADANKALNMIQRGELLPEPKRTAKGPASTAMLRRLSAFAAPQEPEQSKSLKESTESEKKFNPLETCRQQAIAMLAESLFDIGDVSASEPPAASAPQGTGFLRGIKSEPKKDSKSSSRSQIISNLSQAIEAHTQGDLTTANSFFEKALRAGLDNAALYYTLASNYLDQENYKEAIKHFTSATKNPAYASGAHYGLGVCYARTDKMKDAVIQLINSLRAVDLTTVPAEQADALVGLYENFYASMDRENPSDDDLISLGENLIAFLSGADWEERVKVSREQLNLQQGGALAPLADLLLVPGADRIMESMSLINKYMANNWLVSAMDEAHRAIESSPLYIPAHLKIAEILTKENKLEAAVAKYTVVANLYHVRGDGSRTAKIYEEIARLAPMDINARAKLIEMLNAQGKTGEAVKQYIEMAESYYNLADLEMARKTYADALTLAQRPSAGDRSLALKILLRMGDIDMQRLDWRQAMVTYAQVKSTDPSNMMGRAMLVDLYFRNNQARQALGETDDFLKMVLSKGDAKTAIAFLEQILRDHADDIGIHSRLARLYQETGRKADAIAQLDTIGELQLQSGNRAEAIKTIQAIIAMSPDNVAEYQAVLAQLQSG
jgi:tetratricopeptide (TPR) repeat protein